MLRPFLLEVKPTYLEKEQISQAKQKYDISSAQG